MHDGQSDRDKRWANVVGWYVRGTGLECDRTGEITGYDHRKDGFWIVWDDELDKPAFRFWMEVRPA